MFDTEKIKSFPETPGCYLMKDISGKIIYVGKAKNLKKRVIQYFNGQDKRTKIESMRKNIYSIDYIVASSELEALILENNLIKEHRPFFNTLLKDDKQYPYIKITNEEYPRILITRSFLNDKASYYGPYTDSEKIKEIIEVLQHEYKLILCNNFEKKGCMYYDINKCSAPCLNKITNEEYLKNVAKCKEILSGNIKKIIKKIEIKMKEASSNLEFEKAAIYRDEIESIKYITNKQFVQFQNSENEDIIVSKENIVVIFRIRDGKLLSKNHFFMTDTEDIISNFIKQFYTSVSYIPSTIYLDKEIEDIEVLSTFLENIFNKKVVFKIAKKGKKKKLLDLAIQNVDVLLNEEKRKIIIKKERELLGIKHLEKLLGFEIKRIESFDISNTSGIENVASMVVFEDGKPQKKKYRKFKLKTSGPDDYACMEEVINRRFTDEKLLEELPSVLFIDGGLGQVSSASKILEKLGIKIPICGMVKDDNHNTRALLYNEKELDIEKTSPEFKLITYIQDETHNFAINYHRLLRDKNMTKSALDDIKGLGEVRKKLLFAKFGTLENMQSANIEELCEIPGITEEIAKNIKNVNNF